MKTLVDLFNDNDFEPEYLGDYIQLYTNTKK